MKTGNLIFKYQYSSPSTLSGVERYINPIKLEIFFVDADEALIDDTEKIGEIEFDRVYPEKVIHEGLYSVFQIFDEDSDFYATDGFKISDGFKFHRSLVRKWKELSVREKRFAYIYSYWLKPEFRGQKILLRAIFNVLEEFHHDIDLFVIAVKSLVIDGEPIIPEFLIEKDHLPTMPVHKDLPIKNLEKYLERIGFESIQDFPGVMFLNPKEIGVDIHDEIDLSADIVSK